MQTDPLSILCWVSGCLSITYNTVASQQTFEAVAYFVGRLQAGKKKKITIDWVVCSKNG